MAVDKGYGSGKSRSAANSSARQRVATGKLSKSKGFREQANARSLRTTGNPVNTQMLESGVGGWRMIAAAIGKMAPKVGGALDGASSGGPSFLKVTADMAAKGNKAAQKQMINIIKKSVTSFGTELAQVPGGAKYVPGTRTLAGISRSGNRVYERGIAKVLGKAGRSDPAFRKLGSEARESSLSPYLESTFSRKPGKGYSFDRYATEGTRRLPDKSILLKNTKVDEYGNAFPGPGFKRMVRRGR